MNGPAPLSGDVPRRKLAGAPGLALFETWEAIWRTRPSSGQRDAESRASHSEHLV